MFCSQCGKRLRNDAKICSDCGEPAERAEYCGGFWGLVGEDKTSPRIDEEPPKPVEKKGKEREIPKPAPKKKPVLWCVLCAILLVVIMFQSYRLHKVKMQLEKIREEYSVLNEAFEVMEETNGDLTEKIENFQSYFEHIQEAIGQLNDAVLATEPSDDSELISDSEKDEKGTETVTEPLESTSILDETTPETMEPFDNANAGTEESKAGSEPVAETEARAEVEDING